MNEAAKANKNKAGYPKTDEVKEQNEEDESQKVQNTNIKDKKD